MAFKCFYIILLVFCVVQLSLFKVCQSLVWTKRSLSKISPLTILFKSIVNHPSRWAPDERCDVSLTEETTNTKHTHKRSEAQWPSDTIHTKLVSKTLIKSWLWLWVCNLFVFQRCKGCSLPPRGSFIVVRSDLQSILRLGSSGTCSLEDVQLLCRF